MQFSDTTNKNGLIQDCEFWTALGDAQISGDTTLLKVFTSLINQAEDQVYPLLVPYLKSLGYDDPNNTGNPVKTANIVSGTNAYTFSTDDNALQVLALSDVAILQSSSATQYGMLEKITRDDPDAPFYISPNSASTGIPSKVLILGKKVYFDVIPNYNATNGVKAFFSRQQTRFVSTDTTAVPGAPLPFHRLYSLYASHDWLTVNKPDNTALITRVEAKIAEKKRDLIAFVSAANPVSPRLAPTDEDNE